MIIVQILGHLGKDPETRYTPSGQKVTTFSVATNSRQGGNDITTWVRVTVWGDNNILQYLKKGSAVIVSGEMTKVGTFVDKNGATQVSIEVKADALRFPPFGGKERSGQDQQGSSAGAPQGQPHQRALQNQEKKYSNEFSEFEEPVYSNQPNKPSSFSTYDDEEPLPF